MEDGSRKRRGTALRGERGWSLLIDLSLCNLSFSLYVLISTCRL